MQAIKEKLNDMSAMRKAKAEAKEEEKVRKYSVYDRIFGKPKKYFCPRNTLEILIKYKLLF